MNELKPCPFCGSKEITTANDVGPNDESFFEWIECEQCGAKANDERLWNTRPTVTDEEIEREARRRYYQHGGIKDDLSFILGAKWLRERIGK